MGFGKVFFLSILILSSGCTYSFRLGSPQSLKLGTLSPLPTAPWIRQVGLGNTPNGIAPSGAEQCTATIVDNDGNVYCGGSTGSSLNDTLGGGTDAFIAKYDTNGNQIWISQIGTNNTPSGMSSAGNDSCSAIALDSLGNIFCTGGTTGSLGETNAGGADIFIAKFTSTGTLSWVKQFGTTTLAKVGGSNAGSESASGIKIDDSNNIYITGATTGAFAEPSAGGYDVLAMKLNSNGTVIWARQFGATTNAALTAADTISALAIGSDHSVYLAGTTSSNFAEVAGGGGDALIIKLNSDGTTAWTKQYGSVTLAAPGGSNAGADVARGINVGIDGYIYVTGNTTGSMAEANGGSADSFALKLNASNGVQVWGKQLGAVTAPAIGISAAGSENAGNNISAVGPDGSIYIAYGTKSTLSEAAGGGWDMGLVKLDANGYVWAKNFGTPTATSLGVSAANDEWCLSVAVDRSGNVFCGGRTSGTLTSPSGGSDDIVIAKITANGTFGL